jgi:hypothetical protein
VGKLDSQIALCACVYVCEGECKNVRVCVSMHVYVCMHVQEMK